MKGVFISFEAIALARTATSEDFVQKRSAEF